MMSNSVSLIIKGFILLLFMSACNDFLEESSQDEIRPATVNDLEQLMLGEAYPLRVVYTRFLELMTDNISSNYPEEINLFRLYRGEPAFTWRDDMYEIMYESGNHIDDSYRLYYKNILGCNVILDLVDNVDGTYAQKANIKGQMLALRSFYYFMLVNLYAQPYNAPGIDITTAPGVPIHTSSIIKDDLPKRESIEKVYKLMENDLLESIPLLDLYGKENPKYKVTDLFAYTLLSRVYLYMENWEKAIEYADKVLERNPYLLKLANITIPNYIAMPTTNVFVYDSPEAIWLFSDYYENMALFAAPSYGQVPAYEVSDDLISCYEFDWSNLIYKGDLRTIFYFQLYYISATTYDMKWLYGRKNTYSYPKGMRVAESYLNRAESKIELYIKNGDESLRIAALSDLNHLREYRYDTRNVDYVPVDIIDGKELLEFCRNERRRELPFEEHRWFDLRRHGMPEIKHLFQAEANQPPVEYVLKQGDKRYVLPISQYVLQNNPALEPNP